MFLSDLEDGFSIFVDANIFIYHFCKKSKLNPERNGGRSFEINLLI